MISTTMLLLDTVLKLVNHAALFCTCWSGKICSKLAIL